MISHARDIVSVDTEGQNYLSVPCIKIKKCFPDEWITDKGVLKTKVAELEPR